MKVLLLGGGGREHALAWKISQSEKCDHLYIAPGNAGTTACGENVALSNDDFEAIEDFVLENGVYMVVVGPEAPLVDGLRNYFLDNIDLMNIPVIGPATPAARLEGSKAYAKKFMQEHDIPTARYHSFDQQNIKEGHKFLETLSAPYVLKSDGLAGGKGVLICHSLQEAHQELDNMIEKRKFGAASEKVVIEEFLEGNELSVFVLTDGQSYKIFPTSKDYKRIGEGGTGLNTGGMGAISPAPSADKDLLNKVEHNILQPTLEGLQQQGNDYKGFLYLGLMNVDGDPYLLEYNVRLGDPEAQVVLPRLETDILDLFEGVWKQTLDRQDFSVNNKSAATVVMASGGYPKDYQKGKVIKGLSDVEHSKVFHAGTAWRGGEVVTDGGRVLGVTAQANQLQQAVDTAYKDIKHINFEQQYFRTDIGQDELKKVSGNS